MVNRRGVVLVEALVASLLLGAALVAMTSLAADAIGSQASGRRVRESAMLLDEQLALVLARGPDDYASRYPTSGPCDAPFQAYAYRLEFEGGSGGLPYLVRCTVSWSEGARQRSETIETMIAPRRGEEPDPDRAPTEPIDRENAT